MVDLQAELSEGPRGEGRGKTDGLLLVGENFPLSGEHHIQLGIPHILTFPSDGAASEETEWEGEDLSERNMMYAV